MRCFLALCVSASASAAWTDNAALRDVTLGRSMVQVPRFTMDLDRDPEHRWDDIAVVYKESMPAILDYLHSYLPKWAVPIVEKIGGDIDPYFSAEYAGEMKGAARALDVPLGDIVMMNLVYQLEHIGINCTSWNNTGPTVPNDPGCMAIDPKQEWCYCKNKTAAELTPDGILAPPVKDGPGLCTSVVAQDADGHIFHGRNLDWNLDYELRKLVIDVDFQRDNQTVYTGTSFVGFSGILNGVKKGVASTSIDARGKGGKAVLNLLQALLEKSLTPTQNQRKALELATDFASAVAGLGAAALVNEIYYVVGGVQAGEGVVMARDRNTVADAWYIKDTPSRWFALETNYDHWLPVPTADDRRTPGNANMAALGQANVGIPGVTGVMSTWPTFNHHTDYTGVFAAFNGTYESHIWTD